MKQQLAIALFLLCSFTFSIAQTTLEGEVTDENGEELIVANVIITKNGVFKAGASTDFNGNYSIHLDPGTYEVTTSYVGYTDQKIVGVIVKVDQANKLNLQMSKPMGCVVIYCGPAYFHPPLIDIDNTTTGSTFLSEDIQNSPFRDPKHLIINTPGVSPASY